MEEFITNDFVHMVLSATIGFIVGVWVLTRLDISSDRKLLNNLLELEDNINVYKTKINELTLALRLAEVNTKEYEPMNTGSKYFKKAQLKKAKIK